MRCRVELSRDAQKQLVGFQRTVLERFRTPGRLLRPTTVWASQPGGRVYNGRTKRGSQMARITIKVSMFALVCSLNAAVAWADGAVYAMTNALGNNQILVYHRASNGSLSSTPIQTISTGGGGS